MRERHLIGFLTTVQFVHMVDFVIMMPLAPLLMRAFGIGTGEFALMLSAYTFAAAASGIAAGFLIDRFDRRRALLPLMLGLSLATMACAWAPTHHWMIAMRALAGAFGGVLSSLVMAIIPDVVPPERRGRAIGVVMTSFALASIIGIPIGMTLATTFTWHTPFLALGCVALCITLWGALAFPSMRHHVAAQHASPAQTVRAIFGRSDHWWAFALTFTMAFAGFTVIPFISPSLVGNVGFRDDQLQYVYLTGGLASVMTSPWIGRLSDRFTPVRVFTVTALASVFPLLAVTNLPPIGVPLALAVTVVFIIFVSGRFVPATTLIANTVEPRLRGSFMSFNSAVMSAASGFAALVAGALVTKADDGRILHYPRVGWLAAACTLASVALAWTIVKARKQVPPP